MASRGSNHEPGDARTAVARPRAFLPLRTLIGFVVAIFAVLLVAVVTLRSLESRTASARLVTHTFEVLQELRAVMTAMKDAERGQRGFLLTGEERYLAPLATARAAIAGKVATLRAMAADHEKLQHGLDALEPLVAARMEMIDRTIELRRAGDVPGALSLVGTARGNALMDGITRSVEEMERSERDLLAQREAEWREAARSSTLVSWSGSILLLLLIVAAAVMTSRDHRARETEAWLRAGQVQLGLRLEGELRLDKLGDDVLAFLGDYLGAQVGAVYVAEGAGRFRRIAGYALAPGAGEEVRGGEGLAGQAAKEGRTLHVTDVPEGYLPVASGLGQGRPRELLVAPATVDRTVQAVVELGFFRALDAADRELLDRVSESLAVAVRSSKDRTRLEELLEETQRQAEELQAQQEELRVVNEELEEQSSALKESQARLEAQHAELEQTNSQLEEQTQLLESQKDDLTRAQHALTEKADALERSNQYKSEFLANMSHELRTPLNSSLILAKLLADNKDGNLTEEQVRYAQTISSAGNDLLALINDILDLSKIEAGKVEVESQPVLVAGTVDSLVTTVAPIAEQKGLALSATIEPGTPDQIETDPQRLGQILSNLLSNALKFTERGEVTLRVFSGAPGTISFTVRDTGVGIPAHQHEVIFEAFRQADGSTHRKYGGTGLGLSISRDLARLLGGDIALASAPGEGSAFTVTLPLVYTGGAAIGPSVALPASVRGERPRATAAAERAPRRRPRPSAAPDAASVPAAGPRVEDDREALTPDSRRILVIEDDMGFAAILRDLAHELGFQCVVAHAANEGLAAAEAYAPSAIVLDINLPDYSGLGVLDQLKRNAQTRHIPVHVVSVADYAREALELGAVGYALKPVKREQLVEAFERLEAKLSQDLRRVLVVEDDRRQRESIEQLLADEGVQVVGAETADEALGRLRTTTFDCMVMDLNLPDVSGYDLLERMAEQEGVSFPPVIVYTGRLLTRDEEQRLRRFAKSIIIKDVRSPERLLDEVTLFLHQVEAKLPPDRQRMLKAARDRDTMLEGRRILVVEDDVRNIFALSSVLEPKGVKIEIARNGREAIEALRRSTDGAGPIDLVLMDIMMPEMDGLTAMREIRRQPEWRKLPIIALTAKAMKDDQERCLEAGANDYIAKPLDVEKLLSLVRVWMPK